MAKQNYVKCPRCELNYILKKDKYCEVCKQEMKAGAIDDDELELYDELELCPVCHVNYINEGETMCASCLEESLAINKNDEDPDWREYVDKGDEDDDLDLLPTSESDEIDEELDSTFAKDLDAEFKDDFDDVDDLDEDMADELDLDLDLSDADFDDEDDDEEDNDDDDDDYLD